jgi:predicted alpha-1,6-mannanase (GH76 family)
MRSVAVRILCILCILACSREPAPAQSAEELHHRADTALQSFLLKFWSQGHGYLRSAYPDEGSRTGYWTFAQGFDALLDGVERTGGRRYAGLIETFYEAQAARGWLVGHYDDECWMALALMRAHDLTGEDRYLETATDLFADIMEGWDTTCCGEVKGGLWWDKAHTQKATASNAGAVIAGARLFERTGVEAYLEFAKQAYDFWHANMVDPARHHVLDHIDASGDKVDWKFTYNEGLMIGAGVELHRQTGDAGYLNQARAIAGFLLSDETVSSAHGRVLSDGSNSSCGGDCHAFKGPAYRYLKLLHEVSGGSTYRAVLEACVNALWNLARNADHDLFSVSWTGPVMASFSEPQSAAAVMALNLYPLLEGPYPGTGAPMGQYEAEDAAIDGVGLEATHGDFSGWGYIAGWNGDGQGVTFDVHVLAGGPHDLVFRYATGAGDATRILLIDGGSAVPVEFPGTGSWATYETISLRRTLAAGKHRVALVLDAGRGSSNYLNLDHLRLKSVATLFVRGDANQDAVQDLSDALTILLHLFGGGAVPDPSCEAALDIDGNHGLDVTDAVALLRYLFQEASPPAAPFPECGAAPPGELPCGEFVLCE